DQIDTLINLLYPVREDIYENIHTNKSKTFQDLKIILDIIKAGNRIVMVVDDFDLIDETSYEFLKFLIETGFFKDGSKLILLYRRDGSVLNYINTDKLDKHEVLDVVLAPISLSQMRDFLLDKFNPEKSIPDIVLSQMINNAGGNFAYLEQALSHLVDMEIVSNDADALEFDRKYSDYFVPPTFDEILKQRFVLLRENSLNAFKLLGLASYLGGKFNKNSIIKTLHFNDDEFDEYAQFLIDANFIVRLYKNTYAFKNNLVWTYIYDFAKNDSLLEDLGREFLNNIINSTVATPTIKALLAQNTGDKKPILRIKRKVQEPVAPAAPAAPLPPVPPAPAAPAAPNVPTAAASVPPVPQPVQPVATEPVAQTPVPEIEKPQEEKHHTILRRRRPSAHTILEKTRTIDHSIELPLSELKKHNWPLEVPLIPTYTLENMTISVNRFAHATAISVIDNPGRLYNPLVLHGASGTGKTHFLHAIGYALSKKFGQENIFITNGVRLSRGIQRYVMEGNIKKFEEFTNNAQAILIDDIHLLAVNEQNRAHLSKLLKDFRAQHKQIVVTSKYPPESLAKLEELLDFKLDSGWISELKDAAGKTRTQIIQRMLLANNISITDEDANRFFGKPNMSLGTVNRAIRRVRVLERLIFPQLPPQQRSSKDIFEQLLATTGEDRSSQVAIREISEVGNSPVTGNGEWGKIGFFYPQNNSNMMNWLLFALQQRAKELGIPGGPELAVRSSYSTDNIISSAFKIANLCDNKKLKGAVILGPELDVCESSVRENFYDILTHMLEIMLIRCGVINY
ncbi:MAG: ATP-binding protein, partial [Alphaproteobacteria bacterium]|nr:ATP-binding protein [Alphaproteobacteria bacterium]